MSQSERSTKLVDRNVASFAQYNVRPRLLGVAGILHATRYTPLNSALSNLIAPEADPTVVADLLSHANANMLIKVYAHALEERKRMAAGLINSAFAMRALPVLARR